MRAKWHQNRNSNSCREIRTALEPRFQVCCTSPMADEKEKKGSKDVILWIITVALVALAIFLYKK